MPAAQQIEKWVSDYSLARAYQKNTDLSDGNNS